MKNTDVIFSMIGVALGGWILYIFLKIIAAYFGL
jgi:hypothetical protein